MADNKSIKTTSKDNIIKPEVKSIDTSTLRFMSVAQIDAMISFIVNNNSEVFNIYFMLQQTKEQNKVKTKEPIGEV